MQHRILNPVFLQRIDGKSLEEFLLAAEVGFQRGYEQALSETAGTAEEDILAAALSHLVNKLSLVHIDIAVSADIFEILYADRITHNILFFSVICEVKTFF